MSWFEKLMSEWFFNELENFENANNDISSEDSGEVDVQDIPDPLPS